MKKSSKNHILRSTGLVGSASAGIALCYNVAQAEEGQVRVETIEIDFEERVEQPVQPVSTDAQATTFGMQNQFIFLFALTVLGMVGIVGIVSDFRRKR